MRADPASPALGAYRADPASIDARRKADLVDFDARLLVIAQTDKIAHGSNSGRALSLVADDLRALADRIDQAGADIAVITAELP